MTRGAALPPVPLMVAVLAAALSLPACSAADDPPARPLGEEQALERSEAMLRERVPEPTASSAEPAP